MTSHREAPGIGADPVADNTDVYAFVSPDAPTTVTLISNFIPQQDPAAGPNFFNFANANDVLYEIMIDNNGDGVEDVTYQFQFQTHIANSATFLYNGGQIAYNAGTNSYTNLNMSQTYAVTKVLGPRRNQNPGSNIILGSNLIVPPANIGPRSTPNYDTLVAPAIISLPNGYKVFAGPRGDGFYVDLGSIFDLGTLRPFENLHLIPTPAAAGVDATKAFNIHSIAIQVPITELTSTGRVPSGVADPTATIGVWSSASRRKVRVLETNAFGVEIAEIAGPWYQVSRLGNPLINEVVNNLGQKDYWNSTNPAQDSQFVANYNVPQLQGLLPFLYPGVFPNLAAYAAKNSTRPDLVAVLLTGLPTGVIPGFQNYTGATQADELRLNVAVSPSIAGAATTNVDNDGSSLRRFGILGGDLAGFPNGRRVFDNVVAIELRAIAGATLGLVAPTFVADGAAGLLTDGTTNPVPYNAAFPYLPDPAQGYTHSHE